MVSVVGVVVAFVVMVMTMLYVMSPEVEGKPRGVFGRMMRYVPLQPIKIIIVAWQILTQVRARQTHHQGTLGSSVDVIRLE